MKTWQMILIAVVIVLIFTAGIFYLLWPKNTAAPSANPVTTANPFPIATPASLPQSPDAFAIAFYTWYIGNKEQSQAFPPEDTRNTILAPWLTPQFIAQWQSIINASDADPVLWAQDDPSTWGSGIRSSVITQSSSASTVVILVGSGSTVHSFTIQLLKSGDSWKIDSVSGTY